jgi:hypothetical protein
MGWFYMHPTPIDTMVLEAELEEVAERSEDLPDADDVSDRDGSIPVTELFDAAFVQANTEFESFDEMVAASPSDADSPDELDTVRHGAWDEFVAETTDFRDEEELVMAARDHWVAKKLDLV